MGNWFFRTTGGLPLFLQWPHNLLPESLSLSLCIMAHYVITVWWATENSPLVFHKCMLWELDVLGRESPIRVADGSSLYSKRYLLWCGCPVLFLHGLGPGCPNVHFLPASSFLVWLPCRSMGSMWKAWSIQKLWPTSSLRKTKRGCW